MHTLNKYLIKATDQFDPEYFSSVNEEVATINTKTESLPVAFRPEIIVSFLKKNTIQNDWAKANPELIDLATSGSLFMGNIEALFASSRNNPGFQQDLEIFLMKSFTEPQTSEEVRYQ